MLRIRFYSLKKLGKASMGALKKRGKRKEEVRDKRKDKIKRIK